VERNLFSGTAGVDRLLTRDNRRQICTKCCVMLTYNKLGRHAEAEAAFAKTQAKYGDRRSFCYVELYAQWGDKARALDWLETGMVLRTPDLRQLKHPLLDPLRAELRFQAIERELKLPD
jgi:hypothetical protein